jgi:hypothetical protein
MNEYEELKGKVQALLASGEISPTPTREQRIDFAYGNTKIENQDVTHEMAVHAVDARTR